MGVHLMHMYRSQLTPPAERQEVKHGANGRVHRCLLDVAAVPPLR